MLDIRHKLANVQGEFRMIDKNELRIDEDNYQRLANPNLVAQIVDEGWNWPKAGALTVAERPDGSLWIDDGGNRHRGAMQLQDVSEIACMVFQSNGPEEEAGTFSELNTDRKRLGGEALQKGMVTGGSPTAIFVHNLVIQASQYGTKTGRVVNNLRTLAGKPGGKERLRIIWPIVVELFRGIKVEGPVISGLYWIEENSEGNSLREKKWRDAILERRVNKIAEAAHHGGATTKASPPGWGMGILKELNYNKKVKFKLRKDAESAL